MSKTFYRIKDGDAEYSVDLSVFPYSLRKAITDYDGNITFLFLAKLKTGELVEFTSAKYINKNWIHFKNPSIVNQEVFSGLKESISDKGMDVSIKNISWVNGPED